MSGTAWAWPWWTVMVIINAVNLGVCAMFYRSSVNSQDGDSTYLKRMRIMGLIFALVAAYRSVFVSSYLVQLAWFDSVANSSLLIRLFAIAAELSFSGLIAHAMLRVNRDLPVAGDAKPDYFVSLMTTKSPYVLMMCIFLAQFFATGGLISKSRTLFAIEETLWTVGFLAVLPVAVLQFRRVFAIKNEDAVKRLQMLRTFTTLNVIWCVLYCSYGLFYHLPLQNWAGAIDQLETGLPVIRTGISAIADAFVVVNESKEYSDWGFGFLVWHSAYFSVCVWFALFLMRGPRIIAQDRQEGRTSASP